MAKVKSIVKKVNFTGLSVAYIIYVYAQIIKLTKYCVLEEKFTQIWIKSGDLNVSILCYLNIYNLYMYKHETIRNWLIDCLTFIWFNWNLETTDWLTSCLVKVHSTTNFTLPLFHLFFILCKSFQFCKMSLISNC